MEELMTNFMEVLKHNQDLLREIMHKDFQIKDLHNQVMEQRAIINYLQHEIHGAEMRANLK